MGRSEVGGNRLALRLTGEGARVTHLVLEGSRLVLTVEAELADVALAGDAAPVGEPSVPSSRGGDASSAGGAEASVAVAEALPPAPVAVASESTLPAADDAEVVLPSSADHNDTVPDCVAAAPEKLPAPEAAERPCERVSSASAELESPVDLPSDFDAADAAGATETAVSADDSDPLPSRYGEPRPDVEWAVALDGDSARAVPPVDPDAVEEPEGECESGAGLPAADPRAGVVESGDVHDEVCPGGTEEDASKLVSGGADKPTPSSAAAAASGGDASVTVASTSPVPDPAVVQARPSIERLPDQRSESRSESDGERYVRYRCGRCGTTGHQRSDQVGHIVTCSRCGRAMRLTLKT